MQTRVIKRKSDESAQPRRFLSDRITSIFSPVTFFPTSLPQTHRAVKEIDFRPKVFRCIRFRLEATLIGI